MKQQPSTQQHDPQQESTEEVGLRAQAELHRMHARIARRRGTWRRSRLRAPARARQFRAVVGALQHDPWKTAA